MYDIPIILLSAGGKSVISNRNRASIVNKRFSIIRASLGT
jgi:hypothetical protein